MSELFDKQVNAQKEKNLQDNAKMALAAVFDIVVVCISYISFIIPLAETKNIRKH